MKDFKRTNFLFSLCGLNCGLCSMKLGGYCPGCGGGAGNQSCQIAKCSIQHDSVEYCFICSEYPCQRYEGIEKYDFFITHQRQLKDIDKAQQIGIKAYNEEQTKKIEILKTLIYNYNDGRRKSFYCVAVNLLPVEDIENIMRQVSENSYINNLEKKEKSEYLVNLFQNLANQQGILLKLRKKPFKK